MPYFEKMLYDNALLVLAYLEGYEASERRFLPHKVVVATVAGEEQAEMTSVVPFLEGKVPRDGLPTAYVCERYVCQLPTTDLETFGKQIAE